MLRINGRILALSVSLSLLVVTVSAVRGQGPAEGLLRPRLDGHTTVKPGGGGGVPPPIEQELTLRPAPIQGGSAPMLGGPASVYCDYDQLTDFPIIPGPAEEHDFQPSVDYYTSELSTFYDSVKGSTSGNAQVIHVPQGIYDGPLYIDVTGLNTHVIFHADDGPDNTTIDAGFADAAVVIYGATTAPGARISFGWLTMNLGDSGSPFEPGSGVTADGLGLKGFHVTNGSSSSGSFGGLPAGRGSGIVVGTSVRVGIAGNWIEGNGDSQAGGGIYAYQSGPLQILGNDISFCTAAELGAGIGIEGSPAAGPRQVIISHCWIHDNTMIGSDPLEWQGGGIYAAHQDLEICGNWIYRNTAAEGGGVYFHYVSQSADNLCYLEENEIHDNAPALVSGSFAPDPTYRGGGVCVTRDDAAINEVSLGLVRNVIFRNGFAGDVDVISGGGVVIDMHLTWSSSGPFGSLFMNPFGQLIVGNAIYQNKAQTTAGGLYLRLQNPTFHLTRLWTNTIWENTLTGASPSGTGLYAELGESIDASSNIINGNVAAVGVSYMHDWFVDDPLVSPFRYCSMPQDSPTNPSSTANVFGPNCFVTEPDFALPPNPSEDAHQTATSPTVDTGEPSLQPSYWLLGVDIDGEDRNNGVMDVGADEYHVPPPPPPLFSRGDVNDDGNLNLADPITLLSALFVPGTPWVPCDDAADANDDGHMYVSDPVYMLMNLFAGGPPPPSPGPGLCGPDPTSDSLDCESYTHCP